MDEKRKIRSFTDLVAWKEAHALVLEIYEMTNQKRRRFSAKYWILNTKYLIPNT